jgi:NAD(P)-dependent dehydrogenase (short-subunit alcohol dehydrogenase family)
MREYSVIHKLFRRFDMPNWSIADIPSQQGKLAIVTGANSGIGYDAALELARVGAEVVLAGRNETKNLEAAKRIGHQIPGARVRFGKCDLASLASIDEFADGLVGDGRPIDLLINNAGVMMPPTRKTTADGFELQFGTNHLGHFALTGRLLLLLQRGRQTRIVNVCSLAHRTGTIRFDDLQAERRYSPWAAYAQSKLANLLFTFELQRRSEANGWGLMSDAAHPGGSRTDLIANGPGVETWIKRLGARFSATISQSAAAGALPTLFAATSPAAQPSGYYGPNGLVEIRGAVAPAKVAARARDKAAAQKLWEISEQLTGVVWPRS